MTVPYSRLECDIWVPAPIEAVWEFGSNPQNLAKLTPPGTGLRVAADARTEAGARFLIEVNPLPLLGLWIKWKCRIDLVEATGDRRRFIDVQESGPFSHWRHEHIFESGQREFRGQRSESTVRIDNPGTWVRDRVEYQLPIGPLGTMAHHLFVRKKIEDMFAYRSLKMRELFP